MALPNLSRAATRWAVPVTVETYSKTTVDFVETVTVTPQAALATVQAAREDDLQAVQVDITLRYVKIHSETRIDFGQYVVADDGVRYRIITPTDHDRYGFTRVIGEEVKGEVTL